MLHLGYALLYQLYHIRCKYLLEQNRWLDLLWLWVSAIAPLAQPLYWRPVDEHFLDRYPYVQLE